MKITHKFDSGSIDIIDIKDRENIQLKLAQDNNADTKQWFHFKLETQKDKLHKIRFINAGESSFSSAWRGYQVMASYDDKHWFRVKTSYDGNELVIVHTPEKTVISYAYFAPYSYQRHQDLIAEVKESKQGSTTIIGKTNDNNPIYLLIFDNGNSDKNSDKKKVWLIARQHPGETMAQWFIEGLIKRLISQDEVAMKLLENSVFYIVANMNPDGSIRGNHRTNSKGLNLNRQWQNPSKSDCPEVYYVQQEMIETGVDLFLDIHGDEEIPYSFIMSAGTSCKVNTQAKHFKDDYVVANANFQTAVDYNTYFNKSSSCCGSSGCGAKVLSKATDYVESTFDCLSMVLEMPFIDNGVEREGANSNGKTLNSSVNNSVNLGFSVLEPILAFLKS
ncbi:MAG: hypothetical protein JKY81_12845 [Colwellia sp.]|nr:hypothetical protein [Colwellia sp.]